MSLTKPQRTIARFFGVVVRIRAVPPSALGCLPRVMGPGEHGIDRHPDAVTSLLKFINEAIKREPDNRDLRECRELILQSEGGKRGEEPRDRAVARVVVILTAATFSPLVFKCRGSRPLGYRRLVVLSTVRARSPGRENGTGLIIDGMGEK